MPASAVVASILIGVVVALTGSSLSIAYIAGIAGAITQFIAGVFFWMYNRTLQQINMFYQGIMSQQTEALAGIGRSSAFAKEAEKGQLLAAMIKATGTEDKSQPDGGS